MTRDEILLWLNDRLGKSVYAGVMIDHGMVDVAVFEAEGELRLWRETTLVSESFTVGREDLISEYEVGSARLSLSDFPRLEARRWETDIDRIDIELAEGVRLMLIEQVGLPGS